MPNRLQIRNELCSAGASVTDAQIRKTIESLKLPKEDSYNYSNEEAKRIKQAFTQQPQPQAPQPTQTQFAGDVQFTGTNATATDNAADTMSLYRQNTLSLAKFNGMAERLQELVAVGEGRNRLDLMLAGIVQPENPAEIQFLRMAQEMLGHNQSVVPNFLQMDPQGNILIDCQKMLQSVGGTSTALNLLPAAIQSRTVPLLPASTQQSTQQ